jgi:16S rRNA C967 or C1407 C5-methylase (RsmB/RsmF family)
MYIPEAFKKQMEEQLSEEANTLFAAFNQPPPVSIHLHPIKKTDLPVESTPVSWHPKAAYYLPERPIFTLDPAFHAGSYYVQEASSMFIAHAFNFFFKKENSSGLESFGYVRCSGR